MFKLRQRAIQRDHHFTPWTHLWHQPLAALIRMPWLLFFLAMGLVYLAEVLVFTAILHLDAPHLAGDPPMGLPRAFVFAVSAFFANSFNTIEPTSTFTFATGVVAMVSGLITLSTLTGVVFSRLSRSESPLSFSRHCCVSSWNGTGHLFCRFVTSDPSQWLNVSYGLTLIYDMEVEPGLWQRKIQPLSLLNTGTPQLSQTATLTHPLDDTSPLRKLGWAELLQRNAVVMPIVEGVDESTGISLLQNHLYRMGDVLMQRRFKDLVEIDGRGFKRVNLSLLNAVEPTANAGETHD